VRKRILRGERILHLGPPRVQVRAEVGLSPSRESNDVIGDIDMRKRKGERRGPADDLALRIVLAAMARALELVLGGVPGHDTAEVSADGVKAERLDLLVGSDDQVRRVALQGDSSGDVTNKGRLRVGSRCVKESARERERERKEGRGVELRGEAGFMWQKVWWRYESRERSWPNKAG
jgi:hypothetical protein